MMQFKVGDRVRYTGAKSLKEDGEHLSPNEVGKIGTITRLPPESSDSGKWDNGTKWAGYYSGNLEIIEHNKADEMTKINWSGELEAIHSDGRVVPVMLYVSENQPDDEGDYEIVPPNEIPTAYFLENGNPSPNGGGLGCGWRIRNRQPTPSADRLARLEAFVTRVAESGQMLALGHYEEANALVAELNPVDPDVLVARKIALKHALPGIYDGISTYECNEGKADDKPYMVAIVEALRQARKEGNDNGK